MVFNLKKSKEWLLNRNIQYENYRWAPDAYHFDSMEVFTIMIFRFFYSIEPAELSQSDISRKFHNPLQYKTRCITLLVQIFLYI